MEEKISNDNWIDFHIIKSWKLRRYFSFKTFVEPFNIIIWILQSLKILKKLNPDLIFSKWWYVSLPMAIAWKLVWIPVYMHESDSVPWLSNRIVGKFALKIFLWFESAKKYFKKWKCKVVWQILNPELFKDIKWAILSVKTNLLIVAWSQGSTRIFNFVLDNIEKLNNFQIRVILWSQNLSFKEKFEKHENIEIFGFVDHSIMKEIYNITDVAITRAWATNLAELEAFWIKMIIIPLKESANNHQYYNALEYEKKWNIMLIEDNLSTQWIDNILKLEWYKKGSINYKNISSIDIIRKEIL